MIVNVLFLSDQPFLKAANQVIYQTVKTFADKGDTIIILGNGDSGHPEKYIYNPEEVFSNADVKYFEYEVKTAKLLRKLKSAVSSSKNEKRTTTASVKLPESNELLSFEGTRTNWFLSDVRLKLQTQAIVNAAKPILKNNTIDLIYCFEIGVAQACQKLSRQFNIPVVSKYMGTIAYPYIKKGQSEQIKPYIDAYKSDSILHFMLNDGTKGDEVFRSLGCNLDKLRFRIDPVDIEKFEIDDDNGFEVGQFFENKISSDDLLFVTLSNHNAQYKRLDRIIRVFNELSPVNAKLLIIGEGTFTSSYKSLAIDNNSILFTSKIPHESIPRLLANVHVYVNCNDVSNLSHTTLEAMAAGKLILSINDGSVTGVLEHQKNALLADIDDIHNQFVLLVKKILDDPAQIDTLGRQAKLDAVSNFTDWESKNNLEYNEIMEAMHEYTTR